LEIIIVKSFEEIETIRQIWEQMQHNESKPALNADIDHYLSVVESLEKQVQPYVMVLYHNSDPKAMIIGRIEKQQITCRMGYTTIFKPSLRCLSVVYGGILGESSEHISSRLVRELLDTLRRGSADVVFLNHLDIKSCIYRLSRTMPCFLCRDYFPVKHLHWKSSVSGSYEEFLRRLSKNTRHNIRRYQSRLVSKYGDRLRVKCFTEDSQIDQLFKDTMEVAEKTYQYGLGSTFVEDTCTRNLVKLFIDRKLLAAYVLYIDDKPAAFWNGIRYGRTFFTWTTGYDPSFQNDRLGLVLLVMLIEELYKDKNVDIIDFGFGDAQYKRNFCDTCLAEANTYIFAPRFYPIIINVLRSSVRNVNTGLQFVVQTIGSLDWIKRQWRNLLQAKNPDSNCRAER
jgi:hypothetical protein